ncbi:Trp family transcriptional regulator, partial [Treponema sp.]|uniref:Trp family transcriptional regulator n=1 Tax=Treponema sp. TaxID=166 RepID=UPI002A3EFCB2|nr:trp operon repressor [Treponema sp.]
QQSFEELIQIFTDINDKEFMRAFMGCLFTPAECADFADRWILVKEIDKGTTQREIAKQFNMSLCKITRGSKELNKKDSAFRTVLDKYKS